jgi:hypothetical protein
VGVDAAPSIVAAAREVDPGGEYLVADAAKLPFEDRSADLVVAFFVAAGHSVVGIDRRRRSSQHRRLPTRQ